MYKQVLDPVGDSLFLSAIFAVFPLATLFVLLAGLKMRAQPLVTACSRWPARPRTSRPSPLLVRRTTPAPTRSHSPGRTLRLPKKQASTPRRSPPSSPGPVRLRSR